MKTKQILLASTNVNKIQEYKEIFLKLGYQLKSLIDYPEIEEISEPFETFEENALIKAQTISNLFQIPVIADDSGLCVDALDGAPGVHSARWTGVHRDYKFLNEKLLSEMKNQTNRNAHYNTTIVLAFPDEPHKTFVGVMPLQIATTFSKTKGFSYDEVVTYNGQFVSEMSLSEKNKISSRAKAVEKLIKNFT